jgi:hypothetical protein
MNVSCVVCNERDSNILMYRVYPVNTDNILMCIRKIIASHIKETSHNSLLVRGM